MECTFDIYHDLEINAPIEKIFQSISEPMHLVHWWPLKCTGIPRKNEEYNFFFSEEYDWYGIVAHVAFPTTFHIVMTKSDEDWDATYFGFDLEGLGDKVHVSFWHKGWRSCNTHFKRSSYCWAMLLNGLKNYIEKGEILPFETRG